MRKAAAASLVLITLTLCFVFVVHSMRKEAGKTAQGAIDLVKQVLNITPETTITSYVTSQKTTDILELASVSKDFPVDYSYETKWLGSSKKLRLLGEFTVKAGFDFHDRFSIRIDQQTHKVYADFPSPKILSVQQNRYKVAEDTGGVWNRLSQADQEIAANGMNERARGAALELNILQNAKESIRRQLLDLAKKTGQEWEITFRDEQTPLAAIQKAKL